MKQPSDEKNITNKDNYSKKEPRAVGALGGPGSDIETGMNDGSNPALIGMLKKEDEKAARANANLQERLAEVAATPDNFMGGKQSNEPDSADQGE